MTAAAAVGQLVVVAVAAAAVQAAAVTATLSAGQPAGLEQRLRLSTQAARLRLSCARLRTFARRFRGARGLLVGEGWQEKSKCCTPPRVSKTTLHQPRAVTLAMYCCSNIAAAGSREGVAVVTADPWQVDIPCTGGGGVVAPAIPTPPQGGGGEGVNRS